MVAVAASATAVRMRPVKSPRVRIFMLVFLAYFFLAGGGPEGSPGALVCGMPGISSLTSQPQSSPAFLAVFWYSISASMMVLRFGHSMTWPMRRPLINMVGVPLTSSAWASAISFSTSAWVALLSMQAPSLMASTPLTSLAHPSTWSLRLSAVMASWWPAHPPSHWQRVRHIRDPEQRRRSRHSPALPPPDQRHRSETQAQRDVEVEKAHVENPAVGQHRQARRQLPRRPPWPQPRAGPHKRKSAPEEHQDRGRYRDALCRRGTESAQQPAQHQIE